MFGLFNHDPSAILGRTGAGTLDLTVDRNVRLRYRKTAVVADGRERARGGRKARRVGSELAFEVAEDEWGVDISRDVVTRTTLKIARVFDVSPVTHAAYSQTSARLCP